MELKDSLKQGRITAYKGTRHHLVTTSAVRFVGKNDSGALIIDGSASIDPYWMVRVCKRCGFDEKEVLKEISLARGFTAYQLRDLVQKIEDLMEEKNIRFLGLVDMSNRFRDDIDDEEGLWLRSKTVRTVKEIVQECGLYSLAVDRDPHIFRQHGGERHGEERPHVPAGA